MPARDRDESPWAPRKQRLFPDCVPTDTRSGWPRMSPRFHDGRVRDSACLLRCTRRPLAIRFVPLQEQRQRLAVPRQPYVELCPSRCQHPSFDSPRDRLTTSHIARRDRLVDCEEFIRKPQSRRVPRKYGDALRDYDGTLPGSSCGLSARTWAVTPTCGPLLLSLRSTGAGVGGDVFRHPEEPDANRRLDRSSGNAAQGVKRSRATKPSLA